MNILALPLDVREAILRQRYIELTEANATLYQLCSILELESRVLFRDVIRDRETRYAILLKLVFGAKPSTLYSNSTLFRNLCRAETQHSGGQKKTASGGPPEVKPPRRHAARRRGGDEPPARRRL